MIVPKRVGDLGGEAAPRSSIGSADGFSQPANSAYRRGEYGSWSRASRGFDMLSVPPSPGLSRRRASNAGKLRKPKSWRRWIGDGLAAEFYAHGQRVSRHQIRTLLITSLVICSLFYPAVGIFLWSSKGGPGLTRGDPSSIWQSLSTPLLDSFASSERQHYNALRDLRMIWDDAQDLRAMDVRDAAMIFSKDNAELCFSSAATKRRGSAAQKKAQRETNALFPFSGLPDILGAKENEEAEVPACRSVRVEHLFITTDDILAGEGAKHGVLDKPIMQSALRLQKVLEDVLMQGRNISVGGNDIELRCVRATDKLSGSKNEDEEAPCLTLSPMDFWSTSEERLASDDEPYLTLRYNPQESNSRGVPLSITTTLAGRWHLFNKFPRAEYLAMTFFLDASREAPSALLGPDTTSAHLAWEQLLRNVTAGQVALIGSESKKPKELLLQFRPHKSRTLTTSRILLGIGYVALIVYITRGIASVRRVHSRFGLAFTAALELLIAMVMSISVCSLLGIRLTLVPWEIMPFVILVVGSENMFVLINALVTTPIELPVSTRMAQGLASVGVPVTLTVLSDILLMGFIASATPVAAVREFCIFAIFLLIMDWFMQMCFFATILSIDMQRLELADMLTQGGKGGALDGQRADSLDQVTQTRKRSSSRRRGTKSSLKMGFKTIWRARTARTASLSLLLALMFGLYIYYGTGYPLDQPIYASNSKELAPLAPLESTTAEAFDPLSHLTDQQVPVDLSPWWSYSPSASLWQSLNPSGTAKVRMIVEPWSIASLRSARKTSKTPKTLVRSFAGWALFRPRIRAIIWLLKIVVLPISATTALLWVLLLYLLKDTELLEAQRDKDAQPEGPLWSEDGSAARLDEAFDVFLHSGRTCGDIALFAESELFLATVDLTGVISIRPKSSSSRSRAHTWEIASRALCTYLSSSGDGVSAVHLDEDVGLAFVGTEHGALKAISLNNAVDVSNKFAAETGPAKGAVTWIGVAHKGTTDMDTPRTVVIAAFASGVVEECDLITGQSVPIIARQTSTTRWRASAVPISFTSSPIDATHGTDEVQAILLASSQGECEIWMHSKHNRAWVKILSPEKLMGETIRCGALVAGSRSMPSPASTDGSDTLAPELGAMRSALIGTNAGIIRAYDIPSGDLHQSLDIGDGPISKILVPPSNNKDDAHFLAAVQTRSRMWFASITLNSSVSPSSSVTILDGQAPQSVALSSVEPKTSSRPPSSANPSQSNGSYFLGAQGIEDVGAPPRSPSASRSYPMSTHGSRNRRASSYAFRSERTTGAHEVDADKMIKIAGVTDCAKGSADIVGNYLLGIRKAQARSSQSLRQAVIAPTQPTYWQVFAVDLSRSLVVLDGETRVASTSLSLEDVEPVETDLHSPTRGRSGTRLLAFADIRVVRGSADGRSLFFCFGNIVGEIVPAPAEHQQQHKQQHDNLRSRLKST